MVNDREKLIKPDTDKNEFNTGLCSCFNNIPNCFAVWFCLPCVWGRIAHKTKFMGIKGQYWTSLFVVMGLIFAVFEVNAFVQQALEVPIPSKNVTSKSVTPKNLTSLQNETLKHDNSSNPHTPESHIEVSAAWLLMLYAGAVLFVVSKLLTRCLRAKVRKIQNIPGNYFIDIFVTACCFPCAVCQMSSEVGIDRDACNVCYFPDPDVVIK